MALSQGEKDAILAQTQAANPGKIVTWAIDSNGGTSDISLEEVKQ